MPTQLCKMCKTEKPFDAFPLLEGRNAPRARCHQCVAAVDAQRREEALHRLQGMQKCSMCKQVRPVEEYAARKGYGRAPGALQKRCKTCVAAYTARHYVASREREEGRALAGAAALAAAGALTRPCGECKRDLLLSQFLRDRRSNDGYKRTCRECDVVLRSRHSRSARPEDATRLRDSQLRKYGITLEIFELMAESQGQKCFVCGALRVEVADKYGFHVDHDHVTGQVRSLLCRACNLCLGAAGDSPARLRDLALYLEHFQTNNTPVPGSSTAEWTAYLKPLKV